MVILSIPGWPAPLTGRRSRTAMTNGQASACGGDRAPATCVLCALALLLPGGPVIVSVPG